MPAGWFRENFTVKSLQFAWRSLRRDFRAGELSVLLAAIVLAVASMTAVGFFTDRVGRAVRAQAAESLAADMVVRSTAEISAGYLGEAERLGLEAVSQFGFPSVAQSDSGSTLALVSAVSPGYPLRGDLRITDKLFGESRVASGIPGRGEAWAEPSLVARMGIAVGDTIQIGSSQLRVTQVLEYRPDQEMGFLSMAPAVLVNLEDVPAMNVVQAGSRVTYSQLYAGDDDELMQLRQFLNNAKTEQEQVRGAEDASEQVTQAIDRAQRFLTLASLVTVILAAIATAMAARRYSLRHLDTVALLKIMGATQSFIQNTLLLQLLLITLMTAVLGTLLGYGAQYVLAWILSELMSFDLPPANLLSGVLGLSTAATVAVGFALPHLLPLKTTPPMRVLRQDLPPPALSAGLVYLIALAALTAMIYSIVRDLKLLMYIVGGLMAMSVLSYAAGSALVRSLTRFRGGVGVAWRYGLANIARRGRESVVQVVAFGLGLMVLLLLGVVRNDLLEAWQQNLPADAPNYFMVNVQPEDWPGIASLLDAGLGEVPEFLPLIRGRVSSIKGVPVDEYTISSPEARRFVRRESNITWTPALPESNEIRAGKWWGESYSGDPQLSMEAGMAAMLGLTIGDPVGINIGGEEFVAKLTSTRFVEWDSLQPNFYLILSPGEVRELPQTYLTSYYVAPEQRETMRLLLQEYPNVTLIDLEAVLQQLRGVIDKASLAVQAVFVFTILAGVLVLLAAVQVTRDERRFESAILHTLGARRKVILQGIISEFVALGALAGLLGAMGASGIGYLLAENLFDLEYHFDPLLWLFGLTAGAIIVGVTGTLATRKAVNEPPVKVLRNA
jgi:putative ABC transport system permease protein